MIKKKADKTGRNVPCSCGSGKKFKKCCMISKKNQLPDYANKYLSRYQIRLKGPEDIRAIKRAGQLTVEILDMTEELIKPGITTQDIDKLVHEHILKNKAIPATLNYKGYPKSVCTSINEVICHGIPSSDVVLKDGDIINVDVTPILNGYFADASKTFYVGEPGDDAKKIVETARNALKLGMDAVKPGGAVGDIGHAIQQYAEGEGCSVVREFVGHGVGFEFHESPQIPHYGRRREGITLIQGMVFTIEPMINLGKKELKILSDKWTAVTLDGSLTAQFEQTILVTENGFERLTPFEL